MHSRLEPVMKTEINIQQRPYNVLTRVTHRITNAVAAELDSKIRTIEKAACGFRGFGSFRTAIFVQCGGLRLCAVTYTIPG